MVVEDRLPKENRLVSQCQPTDLLFDFQLKQLAIPEILYGFERVTENFMFE